MQNSTIKRILKAAMAGSVAMLMMFVTAAASAPCTENVQCFHSLIPISIHIETAGGYYD